MPIRSDADLVAFSGRLLREAQSFFRVGRFLVRVRVGLRPYPPWEVDTALVESFALHTRALADFFFKRKTYPRTDARAWDFIQPRPTWDRLAGDVPLWLRRLQEPSVGTDRFGAELAHLSFRDDYSLSEQAAGWPVMQVSAELGRVLYAFAENVPPSRVLPHFASTVRREVPLVSTLGPGPHALGLGTPPLRTRPLADD